MPVKVLLDPIGWYLPLFKSLLLHHFAALFAGSQMLPASTDQALDSGAGTLPSSSMEATLEPAGAADLNDAAPLHPGQKARISIRSAGTLLGDIKAILQQPEVDRLQVLDEVHASSGLNI